ncbi:MAG TPA: GNAT family protein [Candidatus Limnocylindria bacterium]|nr:GNAT family protein [Candidatus Limnocylindria bacterium]
MSGPRPVLRGERVFLRAGERDDIPTFVGWFNDGETTSFLLMRAPMSQAAEEGWFDRMLAAQGRDGYFFVICLLGGGQPIGTIGLFELDEINGSAGVGISIGEKSLWGKGFGTDALQALLDFGFGELRLERIWLDVYDYNVRGRRSYEKCGFVPEGTKRRGVYRRGEYSDVLLMSILRDEWAAQTRKRSWDYEDDRPAG